MADGSRHTIYMTKESQYGVTDTNPVLDKVRVTSVSIGLTKDSLQSAEIRDDGQISDFRLGANQVSGDIGFELSYGSFDAFLQAVLLSGDWDSPGTTGLTTLNATATGYTRDAGSFLDDGFKIGQSVITSGFAGAGLNGTSTITSVSELEIVTEPLDGTHGVEVGAGAETITAAEEIHIPRSRIRQSFTLIRYFSDIEVSETPYYIYRGCEINSIQLTIAANSMVTGTFSFVGQSQTLAEDLTDLGTPTYAPISTTSPVDSFTGRLQEAGLYSTVVTEISLTLQNGIEPRFVVGSKNTIFPSIGTSNMTGQVTAYFEDSSFVRKFINETESNLAINLPDDANNVQRWRLPRLKYTGGQPDLSGEGSIVLTMPFQVLLDASEETNIQVERIPASL